MNPTGPICQFFTHRFGEVRRHLAAFLLATALTALVVCFIAIPTATIAVATDGGDPGAVRGHPIGA